MCNKKHLNFGFYKKIFNNETIRCTQQKFKSDYHIIYIQTVHKTELDNKNDKRIQYTHILMESIKIY